MKTREMAQEQISAFADGELVNDHATMTMAALHRPEGHAVWDVYHLIGDALRSDEMALTFSPNFSTRLAARLEAEPTIVAPKVKLLGTHPASGRAAAVLQTMKRFAKPGLAAAVAAVTVGLMTTPQLMVAMKDGLLLTISPVMLASVDTGSSAASPSSVNQEGVVLRDPRIDEYLLAHQRFSPSLYSTAQYARSATFATDSDK